MDPAILLQKLSSVLNNTYNPSQDLRQQAELELQNFLNTPGSISVFLALISERDAAPRDLRLAATLVMKNNIRDFWRTEEGQAKAIQDGIVIKTRCLSSDEKELTKHGLLEILLAETDNSMRKSAAETVKQITEFDPPESTWTQLIPTLVQNLSCDSPLRVYNATVGLRQILKRYEYSRETRRAKFNGMIQLSFPSLQTLLQQLMALHTLEAASIIHISLKIFYSATMYSLPTVAGVDVPFWFNLLAFCLSKPLPEASTGLEPVNQPLDPADRKVWPWWKVKKWASKIISHLFARYGNPKHAAEENQQFATYFKNHISTLLLGPALSCLQLKSEGHYITEDVQRNCLGYVCTAVELAPTYKLLKPHLPFMVSHVILPALSITPEELSTFHDDPLEFVRKVHSIMDEFMDPRLQAQNLIQSLARYRHKDSLPVIVNHLTTSLQQYNLLAGTDQQDHRLKDGIIVAVASTAKILLSNKNKTYKAFVSRFIESELIPEFSSPHAFLRARACWAVEYFDDYKWATDGSPGTLNAVLQGLLSGLRDPALPVQAAAACCMRCMIEADGAVDLIRPVLPQIIHEYFRIMNDSESDSVLSALQAIVMQFGEEVADIAPMMIAQLLVSFRQYASAGEEDDDAQFCAANCLDTILAVLEAVESKPEILASLEAHVCPFILEVIISSDIEYLENIICFIQSLFGGNSKATISETMWSLAGPLLVAIQGEAYTLMEEMRDPLLTFITRDVVGFVSRGYQGVPLTELLLNFVTKALRSDDSEMEREAKCAISTLYCLVGSAKHSQSINHLLPAVLSSAVERLLAPGAANGQSLPNPGPQPCKTTALRFKAMEVVLSCFYYNTPLTVAVFSSDLSRATATFRTVFDNLPLMDNPITQRLIVLSFSSILSADGQTRALLPAEVKANLGVMLQQCLRELQLLRESQYDEPCKSDNGFDGNGDDDDDYDYNDDDDDYDYDAGDDDDDENEDEEENGVAAAMRRVAVPEGGYDEDEDIANAEDNAYHEYLENSARKEGRSVKYIDGEPVDDEDDPFDLSCAIDKEDVLLYFIDSVQLIGDAAQLQQFLAAEDLGRLQEYISAAAARRQALQAQP